MNYELETVVVRESNPKINVEKLPLDIQKKIVKFSNSETIRRIS